uniref:Uncharacterized protein n=1 Tax=Panagrolaimus sp. ES5 TaxID=591445 RepID=A0AC34G1D2_9BILA
MKFVEKDHDKVRQRWLRLEGIKIQLHDIRLKERCKRYIAIWRWATKRKCEKRANQSFSTVLADPSDEAIQGISNVIEPIFDASMRSLLS